MSPRWTGRVRMALGVLLLLAGSAAAQNAPGAKPAAVVNGESIPMADVDAIFKLQEPSPTPVSETQKKQMRQEVLGMLIDDLLMQQFLRKHGPKADPVEVNKRLAELESSLKTQGKTFAEFCKETNQTEAQVRTNMTNILQWAGYVKDRVSDAVVKKYYEDNKEFFDQVTVRASHVVLRVPAGAPDAERQAARAKLLGLRQEIVGGKLDFAEAARKHSQCPSAPAGGDVGPFPRKFVVEEPFARAAFALKVGEVSDVVQTDYGLHVIKVTERTAGQPSVFEKVKESAREFCVEELRQQVLAEQRRAARIEVFIQ